MTNEWRTVMDPPERGEVVLVKDIDNPGWEDKATLVTSGQHIWISELSGHVVFPTHWKELE